MSKRRTDIDFSKHELTVTVKEPFMQHLLKIPGTNDRHIRYINAGGILAVTGDYGNWIFCREFHPSPGGHVSDGYWLEKLQIASTQSGEEFDSESTRAELERLINGGFEEYGYGEKAVEEMTKWAKDCLEVIDDEFEYTHVAYRSYPSFADHECVVFIKQTKFWLKAVFDGFDEICQRMHVNKTSLEKVKQIINP